METTVTYAIVRERILSAGLWSGMLRAVLRGMGFVRNILLARILAPADMGLFGIALVILSILDRFSNTGLQSALIQRKEDVAEYLDTAWWIQAVRGFVLGVGVFVGASYFAAFFNEPRAASYIRTLAVVLALRGIQSPAVVTFIRQLEFRTQFLRRVSGNVVELVISVVCAVVLHNAWALMAGLIAGTLTNVVVSFHIHPFRPRLRFDVRKARELSHYGRWIFLNEVLLFLSYRGDNLVVGKVFGPATLGIYMIAYSISEVATVELSRLVNDVAFPAYSRLQDETRRLRSAFATATQLLVSIALPTGTVLCLLAGPLVGTLLDERWAEAATVLPILALAGAMRAAVANGTAVYRALGRPDLSFKSSVIRVTVMYILMFPLLQYYGLLGVGLAVFGGMLAVVPDFIVRTRQLFGFAMRDYVAMFAPGVILSSAIALAAAPLVLSHGRPGLVGLAWVTLMSTCVYCGTAIALWKWYRTGPLAALRHVRVFRQPDTAPGSQLTG